MVDISTLSRPFPDDVSFNAPNFSIRVGGVEVPMGIRQLVEKVEYESSDGLADMMKVVFRDPRYVPPKGLMPRGPLGGRSTGGGGVGSHLSLRDVRVFQPGNEMTLALGYGTSLKHVGRVVIRKVRPNFPRDDIPTVEVIGYTKDSAMMDNAPQGPKTPNSPIYAKPETSRRRPRRGGHKKKAARLDRMFKNATFADAVRQRGLAYNFELKVDDTHDAKHTFVQKVGLTDYDFVKGLSNITGFFFWVDGDETGKWTLHFRDPAKVERKELQEKVYTFKYDHGNLGTLLEFEPELAIHNAITKMQARVKDPKTGKIFDAIFHEENEDTPDPLAVVPDDIDGNVLDGEYKTASSVKIFIDEYSFTAIANRRFHSEAELIQWTRQWFRRHRENFILSTGTTIGIETVMARQIHNISGIGMGLDGEYFFSNVNHKLSNNAGYELECTMRKVVPELE
jgi:phage protein D